MANDYIVTDNYQMIMPLGERNVLVTDLNKNSMIIDDALIKHDRQIELKANKKDAELTGAPIATDNDSTGSMSRIATLNDLINLLTVTEIK